MPGSTLVRVHYCTTHYDGFIVVGGDGDYNFEDGITDIDGFCRMHVCKCEDCDVVTKDLNPSIKEFFQRQGDIFKVEYLVHSIYSIDGDHIQCPDWIKKKIFE